MFPLNDRPRDYSVTETCILLGVSPPTVYRLLNRGELAGYTVGRSRRITFESIEKLRNGRR